MRGCISQNFGSPSRLARCNEIFVTKWDPTATLSAITMAEDAPEMPDQEVEEILDEESGEGPLMVRTA